MIDDSTAAEPVDEWDAQDEEWLTQVEAGYIGLEKAQVVHVEQTPIERLQDIQGDWPDKDNDPASPEQAWA